MKSVVTGVLAGAVAIVLGIVVVVMSVLPWADLSEFGAGSIRPLGIGIAYHALGAGLGWVTLVLGLVIVVGGVLAAVASVVGAGTGRVGSDHERGGELAAAVLVVIGALGAAVTVIAAAVCAWPIRLTVGPAQLGLDGTSATVGAPTLWVVLAAGAGAGVVAVAVAARAAVPGGRGARWVGAALVIGVLLGSMAVGAAWWWFGRDAGIRVAG